MEAVLYSENLQIKLPCLFLIQGKPLLSPAVYLYLYTKVLENCASFPTLHSSLLVLLLSYQFYAKLFR